MSNNVTTSDQASATPAAPAMSKQLADYLEQQQQRVAELQDLLKILSERGETRDCVSLAYRVACELNIALDAASLAQNGGAAD